MKPIVRLALPVLAATACVALAGGLAGATPEAATAPAARAGTASSASSEPGTLYSVAATSSSNAWAVGVGRFDTYLVMRWNGSRWTVSHYGHGSTWSEFVGVTTTSASNVWAVGDTLSDAAGAEQHTLAEHWNGKYWKWFYTPTPGGNANLTGVAATSTRNAWAVGDTHSGLGAPLIEHWNGTSWAKAHYPAPAGGSLVAVAAASAGNAWAVGSIRANPKGTRQTTLIEHWNGSAWTRVPSPNVADRHGSLLQGVTATGLDSAWAVGFSFGGRGSTDRPLILHWNGVRWSQVHSPNPTGDTLLSAVSAASPTDAWAVGYTNPTRCGRNQVPCGTAAFRWNGKTWTATDSYNPPVKLVDEFAGVAVSSGHNAWAVGSSDWGATLIEHWNGTAWVWRS
jgi:hypothetical protein